MDIEDQEAESNSSSLNVPSLDVLKTCAEAMQTVNDSTVAGEGVDVFPLQSKEIENDNFPEVLKHSPDEASALEPSPAHQHEDDLPARGKSEHEGSNRGGTETSMDNVEKEEGLTGGEGALVQGEQEGVVGLIQGQCVSDEGECVSDEYPVETIEKKEGLAEGNTLVIIDQGETFNVDLGIAANDASMNTVQHSKEEGLAENAASSQNDQGQVVTSKQGEREANDTCTDTTPEGASDQTEQEPLVGSNNSAGEDSLDTAQQEEASSTGDAPVEIEKETDVGLSEGECAAEYLAADTIQGEAPVQIERDTDVGLNEGECPADDAVMATIQDEAPVQPDVGLNEGTGEASMVTSLHQEDRFNIDELPIQIEQELNAGSNEGEFAANDSSLNVMCEVEGSAEDEATVQIEADPDAEVPTEGCQVTDTETPADGQKSEADLAIESDETALGRTESGVHVAEMPDTLGSKSNSSAEYTEHAHSIFPTTSEVRDPICYNVGAPISEEETQEEHADGASCLAEESQGQLVGDAAVLPVEDGKLRGGDGPACETVDRDVDNLEQYVQDDFCELLVLKELIEKADYQSPSIITSNEPPIVQVSGESSLMKEPSLCTPAMEALIVGNEHVNENDTHEGIAGNDVRELPYSKQLETEQPFVEEQVMVESPTEQEVQIGLSLAAEEEAMQETLGAVNVAEEKPIGTVSLVDSTDEQKHGMEGLLTEQRDVEGDIAATPSVVEKDDDVSNSEGEVSCKYGQSGAEEVIDSISPTKVENGDLHRCDINAGKSAWECRTMSNGGSVEPKAMNNASTPNRMSKMDELSDTYKHIAPEEFNMTDGLGTQPEEAATRDLGDGEWEETMGGAVIGEALMDAAVPLSSMVQENSFLHHGDENSIGQQYPTSINAAQDEKARETNGWSPKGSKHLEERDANCNGNSTIVRRTTWWGCCGMLDLLEHKG